MEVVATGGIEPPTQGFSVSQSKLGVQKDQQLTNACHHPIQSKWALFKALPGSCEHTFSTRAYPVQQLPSTAERHHGLSSRAFTISPSHAQQSPPASCMGGHFTVP